MSLQIILILFLVFAVSRVVLQLRQGNLHLISFSFWTGVFIIAIIGVVYPEITTRFAGFLGIGRGADVVVYLSIAVLFYLIFRLTITIEGIHSDITKLVREIAISNVKKSKKKKKK